MPLVGFQDLMDDAGRGGYAVGYFESWSLESLLAVADAAERTRSPVILGFSGIYLTAPDRLVADPLSAYAALGREVGRGLSVPACLLFNESPYYDAVVAAIELGFGLVMYTDEALDPPDLEEHVGRVVGLAHAAGIAVEAEMTPLEGVGGGLAAAPLDPRLTDPEAARGFVARTGVDALAVNVGQAHLHGRATVRLDLDLLERIGLDVSAPLVLHGATSLDRDDLRAAIGLGVRKVNVGSALKQAFFGAVRDACLGRGDTYNPYEVIGSGFEADILVQGRLAMQEVVETYMRLFGSDGKAGSQARWT
jgi:fructose/tagatose bisphosphate aldolase